MQQLRQFALPALRIQQQQWKQNSRSMIPGTVIVISESCAIVERGTVSTKTRERGRHELIADVRQVINPCFASFSPLYPFLFYPEAQCPRKGRQISGEVIDFLFWGFCSPSSSRFFSLLLLPSDILLTLLFTSLLSYFAPLFAAPLSPLSRKTTPSFERTP